MDGRTDRGPSPLALKCAAACEHGHWHREHRERPSPSRAAVPVDDQAATNDGRIPSFLISFQKTHQLLFYLRPFYGLKCLDTASPAGYLAACAVTDTPYFLKVGLESSAHRWACPEKL